MKYQVIGKSLYTDTTAPAFYPFADRDITCDVAIIGGGITGAMLAYTFSSAGISTALLSDGPIGYCPSAAEPGVASSCLLQGFSSLSAKTGCGGAAEIYRQLQNAVNKIDDLCCTLNVEHEKKDVFYFSDKENAFSSEYLALRHAGYDVSLIGTSKAYDLFSFPVSDGLIVKNSAVSCNPYAFIHALVGAAKMGGAFIFENTPALKIKSEPNNDSHICVPYGHKITAKTIILASGFSAAKSSMKPEYKMTFSVVTAPVERTNGWYEEMLLCSKDLRLKLTPDKRIIISGLDCNVSPVVPASKMAAKKQEELLSRLYCMFPAIPDIKPEYTFACEYVAFRDDLPAIGQNAQTGVWHAACPGENGMAFAALAAEILLKQQLGEPDPSAALFAKHF